MAAPAADRRSDGRQRGGASPSRSLALAASRWSLFGVFVALVGKSTRSRSIALMYTGALRHAGSRWQNTLQRAAPLMLTALCVALPAQAGPGHHRRRRRARARRARRRGGRRSPSVGRRAALRSCIAHGASPRWSPAGCWIGARRLRCATTAASTRRSPACCSAYIAIALMNHLVEGPLRDPASLNKPSTTPLGDGLHARHHPRHRTCIGASPSASSLCVARLGPGRRTRRSASRRASPAATRARRSSPGLPVGALIVGSCVARRRLRRARRHGRGRGGAGQRQRLARRRLRLSPASWSPSSRATIRSRSSRSRSCSAASAPPAACCSAGWACPTPRCWCCRASSSSSILASRDALRPLQASSSRRERRADERGRDLGWWGVPLAVLGGAIRVGTPFLFVSLGECLTEKIGRINLGLEGTLVMGAMIGLRRLLSHRLALARRAGRAASPAWRSALLHGGHLQPAASQRHRRRHRADAVRHRARLLPRQALHAAAGADLPAIPLGWLDRHPAGPGRAAGSTCCSSSASRWRSLVLWAFAQHALGPGRAHGRATAPTPRAPWATRSTACASLATAAGGFLAGIGGAFLSLYYPGSWNEGMSSRARA